MITRFKSLVLLLAATLALASCGGGGSDGSSGSGSIAVTFTPASVEAYGNTSGALAYFGVSAKLSQVPTTSVYVYIVDPAAVIQTGATVVAQNSDGSFSATLANRSGLAVGVYTGTLTLRLCKDAACASEYALTGASLPYKITILPATQVTATQNGMPATADTFNTFNFNVGDTIALTANLPVTWDYPKVASLGSVAITSTTFTATAVSTSAPLMFTIRASQLPGSGALNPSIAIN